MGNPVMRRKPHKARRTGANSLGHLYVPDLPRALALGSSRIEATHPLAERKVILGIRICNTTRSREGSVTNSKGVCQG
jgi:hypothetical protein